MQSNMALMLAASVAAIGAGITALPRLEESADILLRDGRPKAALDLFQHAEARARDDPYLAMQVIRINEQSGRATESLAGLERYVERWPSDTVALAKLASVAKSTMNTPAQIKALDKLVALGTAGPFSRELLGLYRDTGDLQAERRLLVSLQDTIKLSADDLKRLGSIQVSFGDVEDALTAYRHADDLASAKEQVGRFKLLDLLLKHGHFGEATERAVLWISKWRDSNLATEVTLRIAETAPAKYVVALVTAVADDALDLDLSITQALADRGYHNLASEILDASARRRRLLSNARVGKLVDVAAASQNPRALIELLNEVVDTTGREGEAARLAEEIAQTFGYDVLSAVPGLLTVKLLAARPLFGVELALLGGNEILARRVLLAGQPTGVPMHQAQRWAELMFTMLGAQVALRRIEELQRHGQLPAYIQTAVDEQSLRLGLPLRAAAGVQRPLKSGT